MDDSVRPNRAKRCHSEEYPKGTCFAARSDVGIRIFSGRNLRKVQDLFVLETDCQCEHWLAMTGFFDSLKGGALWGAAFSSFAYIQLSLASKYSR